MRKLTIALFVISFQYACSKKTTDGGAGADAGGACVREVVPEAPSSSGQLTFLLDATIDPCSVAGYIVGYKDDLKVKLASDGSYFVNNIPPGEHDIIITGSLRISNFAVVSDKDKAVRLSDEKFLAGVKKEKGKVELPTVGSITGKVTLSGQTDHAGIHVYIPGTAFDATTASDGSYTIAPYVPSGVNNLFFEKDGYHRGQIEGIAAKAGIETISTDMELVLSTGADGFLILSGGEPYSNSRTVSVIVGATDDAVLMKISEDNAFTNKSWTPINSYTTYSFNSDGSKTLYVKFADANGLESSPFSSYIIVDSLAPVFNVSTTYTYGSINVTLQINATDTTAMMMKVASAASFDTASWENFSSSKTLPYTKNIKIKLKDYIGRETDVLNYEVRYTAKLSLARSFFPAASVGTKAIFAGGWDGSSVSAVVDIFDSLTNIWASTTLSQARYDFAATTLGTKAMFAGGSTTSPQCASFFSLVDIYDSTTNSWTVANLSQARDYLAATTVGTKAIFAGGKDCNGNAVDVVDIYDSSNDTWSTTTLSQARYHFAATNVGTEAIFAGGSLNSADSNVVDIYNSSNNTWSTASLSQTRSALASTSVGTKAIFAGGSMGGGQSNVVDIYDSASHTWSTATLSQARSGIAATTVGTKAIFAGGYITGSVSNVVDIYDSSTNSWTTSVLSQARDFISATTVGTKAIFSGGRTSPLVPVNTIDIYDSSTGTWSTEL